MIETMMSSSVLIVLIWLVRSLFKGRISPRLQYGLWLLVLVRFSAGWLPSLDSGGFIQSRYSVMNLLETSLPFELAKYGEGQATALEWGEAAQNPEQITAAIPAREPVLAAGKAASASGRLVLGTVWVMGSIVMGTWIIVVNMQFRRQLKASRALYLPSSPSYPLPIYEMPGLKSACLCAGSGGLAVYVAPEIIQNKAQLTHVLTHELCHYRHWDHIWSVWRCVLLTIYWVNPLVWVSAYLSKKDCELACDEAAVRLLGEQERIGYGRTLLDLISRQSSCNDLIHSATTMTGSEKNIRERIQMIVNKPKMMMTSLGAVILIAAVCVVVTFTAAEKTEVEEAGRNLLTLPAEAESVQSEESAAQVVSYRPGDQIEVTVPAVTAHTSFGVDFPMLDFANDSQVIFHGSFGLFVYDLRRQSVVRAVDLEPIGCQYTQGDSFCEVFVSSDGKKVTLHPMNQDVMFVYKVAENTMAVQKYEKPDDLFEGSVFREELAAGIVPSWFSEENIRLSPQLVIYHEGSDWEHEFYLAFAEENLGSLFLLQRSVDSQEPARFPLYSFKAMTIEGVDDAESLYRSYGKMVDSWDYAGVCALTNGGMVYSDQIQNAWSTVKGSAVIAVDEEQVKRGRMSCRLELTIEDPGSTGLSKGVNVRYLYLIRDQYGWFADGPMRKNKPSGSWWSGAIRLEQAELGGL